VNGRSTRVTRESRAIRSGKGPIDRSYSRKSSNSVWEGADRPELLEKVEQFGLGRGLSTGDTRESRAIRSGKGAVSRRCSRKSSNSVWEGGDRPELLEKVEQFGLGRGRSTGVARESRAIRSGKGAIDRSCSRKSSNSVWEGADRPELLEKVEQFGLGRGRSTGVARESRAIRSGKGAVDRSYSRKSSNSVWEGGDRPELLEKVEQFGLGRGRSTGVTRESRITICKRAARWEPFFVVRQGFAAVVSKHVETATRCACRQSGTTMQRRIRVAYP
jgi:hypothetical protein